MALRWRCVALAVACASLAPKPVAPPPSPRVALRHARAALAAACAASQLAVAPLASLAAPPTTPADGRALVEETYDLLDKYYYDGAALARSDWKAARARYGAAAEQLPSKAGAFRAKALSALGADRYTRILDPEGYAAVARFDILGVGLILSPGPDGRATVVSPPLPNSAAAKSGLVKRGDVVDTLDGVKTAGLSSFELLDVVDRAEDKAKATLGVVAPGSDAAPRMISLPRATREVGDPVGRVALGAGGVGYVRLKEFNARTGDRLAEVLRDLDGRGATRYVLDLRGNPGGAFQEAVSAAALFVGDGAPVVTVVERTARDGAGADRRETFRAKAPPKPAFSSRPPVQLWLNKGSASASEIFAGALRDNCAAVVAGERSYGKGKIQAVFGLGDDSGLVVTVAMYLTPRGTTIQDIGVIPDVGLPGLDMPFVPTPLPSAAEFDAAFAKRTCDKPPADFVGGAKGVI